MASHGRGRRINVEGVTYRWSVRGSRTLGEGGAYRLLSIVADEATGQALHVWVRHDDVWVHFSDLTRLRVRASPASPGLVFRGIKPGLVAQVIAAARTRGWEASRRGPTLEFVLEEDQRLLPLAEFSGRDEVP
ncbi:hypothetical protein [Archangium primigenium]|uniref:hypothetical protein n=1 Tax=[Archangium] primigenium TaxID=2792470 RepID=UPI00195BB4D5|nr:hypothetical protein [Archangium primigenium]MBM7114481.1 hypothetical protein [Archangium primigenium]